MEAEGRTLWCGNLSERVTQSVLHELLQHAGPLERVFIPKDRDGRQRNYAFVTYVHDESVPYAFSLFKGTFLYDRQLNLQSKGNSRPDKVASLRDNDRESLNSRMSPRYDDMPYSMSSHKQRFTLATQQMPPTDHIVNSHSNRSNMKDLSIASLTGQWSSKNLPVERFEPYRRDNKSNRYKDTNMNSHGRGSYHNDKGGNDHKHYRDNDVSNHQIGFDRNHRKHSKR